jgi:hypothetical protein
MDKISASRRSSLREFFNCVLSKFATTIHLLKRLKLHSTLLFLLFHFMILLAKEKWAPK